MPQDSDKPNDQQGTQAAASGMAWMNEQRPVLTQWQQAENEAAWFDESLRAKHFFQRKSVTPVWAAKLLCGLNPNKVSDEDALKTTTDAITPDDYMVLLQTFQDGPSACSLLEWMRFADDAGCKVHPWAAKYAKHHGLYGPPAPHREAEPLASVGPAATTPQSVTINAHIRGQSEQPPAQEPPPPGPEESPAPTVPAPVVPESASNAHAWTVTKPQRYRGYSMPLYRLLVAAHREGKPRPTARDVVEAWRTDTPPEIAKILSDGFDYYDAKGDTTTADLEAIRNAIGRMTSAR